MFPFLSIVGAFFITATALFWRHYAVSKQRARATWEELLGRLVPLNNVGIEIIAHDLLDASFRERQDQGAKSLTTSEIWRMVDGMDGLVRVKQNSAVLLDIVAYVHQWHPAGYEVAEKLRANAREIVWHIERLEAAEQNGSLESWFANSAQRAVASYYLMIQSVLPLLKGGHKTAAAEFQRAL